MAQQRRLGTKIFGWLVVLSFIAAAFMLFTSNEDAIEVMAAAVDRGRVEQTVLSISAGTVIPAQDSMIAAGIMGTIVSVPEEGQHFNEGDLLVELDHAELDAQVELAEANLKVGESHLKQAQLAADIYQKIGETRVRLTEAQLALAQAEHGRFESLVEKQAASKSVMDKAVSALRVAEENNAAALASQEENRVREEEILSAKAAIDQLKAAVTAAKAGRDRAKVKAPFPGVVAKRLLDVGEATAMGAPLLQFVRDDACYVSAPFDEANASEIKIGQQVRLNLDAYRDLDFTGEVSYIAPVVSRNLDLSRSLDVKIRINEGREKFVPGMSVDVTIIVEFRDDAVRLPSEALIRQEYVYVVQNGIAKRHEVQTGVGNFFTREVIKGVQEGDQLITSVSIPGLGDGVPVRIVDELKD